MPPTTRTRIASRLGSGLAAAALVIAASSIAFAEPEPAKSEPAKSEPAKTQPATTTTPSTPMNPTMPTMPSAPAKIPVPNNPPVATSEVEGIKIEDLKLGEGYEIKPGGAVVALYHGTLASDPTKVFDSAFDRGEPIAFPLSGVIQGWQKGVPGMKIGGVRRLTIPAALAYGAQSPSPEIPPNSDLVFVIQIIDAVQYTDVQVGTGETVEGQSVPVTNFVVKDAQGAVVAKNPEGQPYVWLPGEFAGLSAGVEGMKVGGKRTIKIPKEFNEAVPGLAANRPTDVALTVEVELVANRNLPRQRR